jgi:hypothetical protein
MPASKSKALSSNSHTQTKEENTCQSYKPETIHCSFVHFPPLFKAKLKEKIFLKILAQLRSCYICSSVACLSPSRLCQNCFPLSLKFFVNHILMAE